MKNLYIIAFCFTVFSASVFGQSPSDVREIVSHYDLNKIKEREIYFRKKAEVEKQKAITVARLNNWPLIIENENGSKSELMKLTADGYPIYYTTDNVNAARTTRTNFLHNNGGMGLNLEGQGMTVREWDGDRVRETHNAFGGRVTVVDDPAGTLSTHSTHVCGTMIASANPASVKGMAPQATARTFNWTSDESEALAEVQLGMLVSNHSYGVPVSGTGGPLASWIIGAYVYDTAAWDEIAYLSPYYLKVASAGNDGGSNANADPIAFGFDKLTFDKTAKNIMVVANAQDAVIGTNGVLTSVAINSFSSQGPTDDFRIKPDIAGNGTSLTSTSSSSNTATAVLTGTSMASPNIAGSLLLLQQHYKNLTNSFMRSSTLKGLACHTADDAGEVGPDPVWGWGLMNAKKAVETLNTNGLTSWVSEESLNQGETYTINVNSLGTSPLMASITWTDVPGPINAGVTPNNPMKALVNDLDIRITRNTTTYFPWRLDPADPVGPAIRVSDNNVDNVEQVKIDTPPAGQYTITVTHKGTLVNSNQKFSLVITGINSAFALNSTSADLVVCSNENAFFSFNYTQTGSGTTNFTAVGLPSGATATFSPASLSANGTVTMTISGLSSIVPGEYSIGIRGNNGTEIETRYKSLRVYNSTFQNVILNTPLDGQIAMSTSAILKWQAQLNAETYRIQVSVSETFASNFIDQVVTTSQYFVSGLSQQTRYYWRVLPINRCGAGTTANAYTFVTGILTCDQTFTATDFSNASIASVANSSASVPLTITGGYTIGDINVNMNITHTYVQDMTISLQGPASIGSPIIILLQEPCGDNDNINCTMDDIGGIPACSGNPSISGLIAPFDSLSSLNSLPADGEWTLLIDDPYNGDGGSVNLFSINLCRIAPALSIGENPSLSNVSIYPNPTKGIVNVAIPNINEKTMIYLYDLQGRKILSKETTQIDTSLNIENLQDGIYLVSIENTMGSTSKKIILRK